LAVTEGTFFLLANKKKALSSIGSFYLCVVRQCSWFVAQQQYIPAVLSTNGNKNKCDIETEMKRMAYTGWLKQTIGNRHVLGVSVKVSD
jgi:hypothetical protein